MFLGGIERDHGIKELTIFITQVINKRKSQVIKPIIISVFNKMRHYSAGTPWWNQFVLLDEPLKR